MLDHPVPLGDAIVIGTTRYTSWWSGATWT